ncbi:MAG: hypothetical protein AAF423_03045 [Pseudomonadota bacterium]
MLIGNPSRIFSNILVSGTFFIGLSLIPPMSLPFVTPAKAEGSSNIPQFTSELSLNYYFSEEGVLRIDQNNNEFHRFLEENVLKSVFIDVTISGSFALVHELACDGDEGGWKYVHEYNEDAEEQYGILMPIHVDRSGDDLQFEPAKDQYTGSSWVETRIEDPEKYSGYDFCYTHILVEDPNAVYTTSGGTGLYNIHLSGFFIVRHRLTGWKGERDLYQLFEDRFVPFEVRQSVSSRADD